MSNGIFVSSIPKSGTHLLSSLIESWSGQPVISVKEKANYENFDFSKYSEHTNLVGHYRISHIKANASLCNLFLSRTVIVVVRDPRDLCNSMLHYVLKSKNLMHQSVAHKLNGLKYEEQIMEVAKGIKADDGTSITPSLKKWCDGFVELKGEFQNTTILRYEDFFDIDLISKSISKILLISNEDARLLLISALSSTSKTKRVGGAKPSQWKSLYSRELKNFFSENFSESIKYLGYEV